MARSLEGRIEDLERRFGPPEEWVILLKEEGSDEIIETYYIPARVQDDEDLPLEARREESAEEDRREY